MWDLEAGKLLHPLTGHDGTVLSVAVGEVAVGGHTLIVHWDGTVWKRVPSPSPSSGGNVLNAVAAASASSAWAVGYAGSSSILATTLIEHWNGRAWTHVPSSAPQPGCGGCQFPGDRLAGVAATSAASAWAVGSSGHGGLIEHWDGTRWRWVAQRGRGATRREPGWRGRGIR
jgi:hypothetical protein